MKCMTCDANIPPEFVAAIQKNECPGCSGPIMLDDAKQLMDELASAMERMPNNPRGIAGWLLSNYRFQKIGDAKPVEKFHQKQERSHKNEQDLKVADNPVQKFLARTGAMRGIQQAQSKLGKGDRHQQLAQMARGIAEIEEPVEPQQDYEDEEEVYEERGPRRSQELITGASLVDAKTPPLTPEEIEELSGTIQDMSVDEAQEALKMQRFKRVKAQQAVLGGGGGSFRRSGD